MLVDTHTHTRLRVKRSRPGYLVISRAYYPGWTARVNGARQELLRADLGLSALRLPAGTSEVELRYAPRSFALGLWTSGLCALALGRLGRAGRPPVAARASLACRELRERHPCPTGGRSGKRSMRAGLAPGPGEVRTDPGARAVRPSAAAIPGS